MATNRPVKVIKVHVTKKDIERGNRTEPATCAVARAIRRTTGHRMVQVGLDKAYVVKRGEPENIRYSIKLPKFVQKFITNFDDQRKVKPITFRASLKVPNETEAKVV